MLYGSCGTYALQNKVIWHYENIVVQVNYVLRKLKQGVNITEQVNNTVCMYYRTIK